MEYEYDNCGRITKMTDGGTSVTYAYDAIGQLIHTDDPFDFTGGSTGTTWVFNYDLGGNILAKVAYPYTNPEDPVSGTGTTITYTYGTSGWKDQLTAYNSVAIQYDAIGNLTNDGTWQYAWQHGKQLAQMSRIGSNETISFEYNEDGLRTKKTSSISGTTEYTLHGKNIVHMKKGTDEMHFFYGADNRPTIVVYNGASYRYMYTLQGDVFGLVDESNNFVVWYRYDAWGKPLGVGGTMGNTLGRLQPFRYRGYVWDEETGLYYLRSWYYRPSWGRFVSADELFSGNIYSYCNNSPNMFVDSNGNTPNVNSLVQEKDPVSELRSFDSESDIKTVKGEFGDLSVAEQYGIMSYSALRRILRGTGFEAHHIIEKRFALSLGLDSNSILSVAVTRGEHQGFTNAWHEAIPYGTDYNTLTVDYIWSVAQIIYAKYPALLDAAKTTLGIGDDKFETHE